MNPNNDTRKRLSRRVVVLVVLLSLVMAIYVYIAKPFDRSGNKNNTETSQQRVDRLLKQAVGVTGNDQSKLVDDYTKAVESETDPAAKKELLWGKAYVEMHSGKLDQALADALAADKLGRTTSTLNLLAVIYSMRNEKTKAIEYYQLQLSMMPKDEESNIDRNSIQYKIEQLKEGR